MAIPETPITRQEMYLDAIARKGGGGGGSDNLFVVMCTPTAEDLSGTMDKTAEEILGAYVEGKSIYFLVTNVGTFLATSYAYDSFGIYIVDSRNDQLIHAFTATTGNRYYTKIYQLTPMGS